MSCLISIIVPIYNLEKSVTRALSSIFNQSWRQIEIIVVDDGSTDQSLNIVKHLMLSEPRLTVLHKENGGVTSARLDGVRIAKGDWIGFVDGDDEIEPDMYERLIQNALEYQADISHCGYQMVFPNRRDLYYGTGRKIIQDNLTGINDLLEGRFVEPGLWNKLFRKELFHLLLDENVMDLSIKYLEDLLMNYYLFRDARQSIYEDFCPYHYLVRKDSASTRPFYEQKLKDPLKILHIIEKEAVNVPQLQKTIRRRIAYSMISVSTMDSDDNPDLIFPYREQVRKELKGELRAIILGDYPAKTKLMATAAVITPEGYNKLHKIVSRIKGTDRKYTIE